MDGKKFLDSSLDLRLEGEGLSFLMGMPFGPWIPPHPMGRAQMEKVHSGIF